MRGSITCGAGVAAACFLASGLHAATITFTVPGNSNPYLSGLPDGATASNGDVAPAQSPVEITGFDIMSGAEFSFAATGQVSLGLGLGPDPDGGAPINHFPGAQNGFSAVTMPRVSMLGVFIGDASPDASPAPDGLDFSTADSRNFTALSPLLKQIFFIGDGVSDNGETQMFIAPDDATRLFLGAMDGFGWFNNSGEFNAAVTGPTTVVPLPAALPLMLGALAFMGAVGGAARVRARPLGG